MYITLANKSDCDYDTELQVRKLSVSPLCFSGTTVSKWRQQVSEWQTFNVDNFHFTKKYTYCLLLNSFKVLTAYLTWVWTDVDVNCNLIGGRRLSTARRHFRFLSSWVFFPNTRQPVSNELLPTPLFPHGSWSLAPPSRWHHTDFFKLLFFEDFPGWSSFRDLFIMNGVDRGGSKYSFQNTSEYPGLVECFSYLVSLLTVA